MAYLDVPLIFRTIAWIQNTRLRRAMWVTPASEILIEGYPRSANTFLHRIIRASVRKPVRIGHHVHRPQQISFAVRYRVPSFILVRDPLHAIASHLVYNPHLTANRCVDHYIRFNERAARYTEHDGVYIIDFEQLIQTPVQAARAIMDRAGLEHFVDENVVARATQDNRADAARRSLPSPYKESLKSEHYASIRAAPGFGRAVELYQLLRARAWRF